MKPTTAKMQAAKEFKVREKFGRWETNPYMLNTSTEPEYYGEYTHPWTRGAWAAWKECHKQSAPEATKRLCKPTPCVDELIHELRTSLLFDNSTLGNRAADALEAAQVKIDHWKTAHASAMFAGAPMTMEQIKPVWLACRNADKWVFCKDFVRAIEAHHKIGVDKS